MSRVDSARERIVEVALELFGERGYHGVALDQIAARAGVTKGAVYAHFAGKRALYLAVCARIVDRYVPPPVSPPAEPVTLSAALAALARGHLNVAYDAGLRRQTLRNSAQLMQLMAEDDAGLAAMGAVGQVTSFLMTDALEAVCALEGVRQGERLMPLVMALWSLLVGAGQGRLLAPDSVDVEAVVAAAEALTHVRPMAPWTPPLPEAEVIEADVPLHVGALGDALAAGPTALGEDYALAVVPIGAGDAVEDAVRTLRLRAPGLPIVVVATIPPDLADVIDFHRYQLVQTQAALARALPAACLPDYLLAVVQEAAVTGLGAPGDPAGERCLIVRGGRARLVASGRGAAVALTEDMILAPAASEVRRTPTP